MVIISCLVTIGGLLITIFSLVTIFDMVTTSGLITIGCLLTTILGVLTIFLVAITRKLFSKHFVVLLNILFGVFRLFLTY